MKEILLNPDNYAILKLLLGYWEMISIGVLPGSYSRYPKCIAGRRVASIVDVLKLLRCD